MPLVSPLTRVPPHTLPTNSACQPCPFRDNILSRTTKCSTNKLCMWRHDMPTPLSYPRGRPSAEEQMQRRSTSHAEYVSTLTAAATLRVKAALSKAAW